MGGVAGVREVEDRPFVFQRPIHVEVAGRARTLRVWSMSLSRRGMFLRAETPLPVNARVSLSIEVRGRALFLGEGTVAYALPRDWAYAHGRIAGFGVDFEELPPRSQALVHALRVRLDRAARRAAAQVAFRRGARPSREEARREVLTAERPGWRGTRSARRGMGALAGLGAAAFVGGAVAVLAGFGF